jgi:hypothetical protein
VPAPLLDAAFARWSAHHGRATEATRPGRWDLSQAGDRVAASWLDAALCACVRAEETGAATFRAAGPTGTASCWLGARRVRLIAHGDLRHGADLRREHDDVHAHPGARRLSATRLSKTASIPLVTARALLARTPGDRWYHDLDAIFDEATVQTALLAQASPGSQDGWDACVAIRDQIGPDPVPPPAAVDDLPHDWDVLLLLGSVHDAVPYLDAQGVQIDAVLSDPPYDSHSADLAYRDAWPPGAWSSTLREHLHALRRVLPPHARGVLHIDEHRGAELELLVRDVFDRDALGLGIWDKRNPKGDALGLASQHERLVWFCQDRATLKAAGGLTRRKQGAERLLTTAADLVATHGLTEGRSRYRAWLRAQADLSEGVRAYRYLDDDGEPYRPVSMAWPNKRRPPDAYFEPLLHPVTGEPCPVPKRGWRNPPETMARLRVEGRLLFGADATVQPTRKYLLREMRREKMPSVVYFAGSDDRLQEDLGIAFPYAKPLALTQQLLDVVAPDGGTVFDGFAGSGTTAHAVLASEVPRRVVLVERDPNVLETTLLPRLRAVLERHPAQLCVRVLDTTLTWPQTGN